MRAVGVRAFKAPIELLEVPDPTPGPNELLIHVGAAGVNPFDWKIADGILSPARPHVFPLVLGMDAAGEVERVGEKVTGFRVGDPVFGDFIHDPIGVGTFAEHTLVPEAAAVAPRPKEVSVGAAAAMPLAGMTALQSLDALELHAGDSLLLLGAAGGVGSFVVQLARSRDLHVVAVSRGTDKDRLNRLGASEVVDISTPALVDELRTAHPDGVAALLALIPDAALFSELAGIVRGGGTAAATTYVADLKALEARGIKGVNVALKPSRESLDRLTREVVAGHAIVPLEESLPLAEGPAALARSKAGTMRGKTVLVP